MRTIQEAKQWAKDNAADLDAARLSSEDETVQMFNNIMPEKSKVLWDSGVWLAHELESHGATADQIYSIQTALGQRAFCGDAWQAAVAYANEFASTGDTEEKGGHELAEKRNREIFGRYSPLRDIEDVTTTKITEEKPCSFSREN